MSLCKTLEKILELLLKQPNIEHQAKLKGTAGKLQKAATDFQEQLELSGVENSVEYATLAGLLNDPSKKKVVTLAWAKDHLEKLGLDGLSFKSLNASAKSQFLLRVVSAGEAKGIIKELSQSQEDKLQDEFAKMARLSDSQVKEALDQNFKASKLVPFCDANGITLAKKGAKTDRKVTYNHILSALAGFQERQKL